MHVKKIKLQLILTLTVSSNALVYACFNYRSPIFGSFCLQEILQVITIDKPNKTRSYYWCNALAQTAVIIAGELIFPAGNKLGCDNGAATNRTDTPFVVTILACLQLQYYPVS